jgi:hypothetical protein
MARRLGLTQKIVYIYAPHPKVSEASLLKAATLDLVEPSVLDPFEFTWKYSFGEECEYLIVRSQTFTPIRENESREFLREAAELGFVIVKDLNNEEEILKQSRAGLMKALAYWRERGNRKIADFRKARGLAKDEMEDYKYDYWPYFLAQAKAEAIQKELKRLERAPARKE